MTQAHTAPIRQLAKCRSKQRGVRCDDSDTDDSSMPGTYRSSSNATPADSPQQVSAADLAAGALPSTRAAAVAAAAKTGASPVPALLPPKAADATATQQHSGPPGDLPSPPAGPAAMSDRVPAAVAELQASSQAIAHAALRQAAAANAALSIISSLNESVKEHENSQALTDAALDGAAASQEELKEVIKDLHAQLLLARQETAAAQQARSAGATECGALKEQLAREQQRGMALQVVLPVFVKWDRCHESKQRCSKACLGCWWP